MLVSFDIKFSDETRNSIGLARLAEQSDVFLFEPDKLDIKRHCHGFLFIMRHQMILKHKGSQRKEKKTQFYLNLLTSRMSYDVNL